ncbi:MAG: SBBP repeat-containing protein [Bacteroidetes bacterium]|nr:SBBP repeat-containing protein [Bacteroidota bacterium]
MKTKPTFFAILLLTLLFAFLHSAFSQVTQQWAARYSGAGNMLDMPMAMTIDASGNVYVTGQSMTTPTVQAIVTVKYNSSGAQQWLAVYSGTEANNEMGKSIAVDGSGNVYVSGFSNSATTGLDIVTIKYNSAGAQQWTVRYNGTANSFDEPAKVLTDAAGNVYVFGQTAMTGSLTDLIVIKYNSAGTELWKATYNGATNQDEVAASMAIDGTGNVYVLGKTRVDVFSTAFVTVKYNAAGTREWAKTYAGPGNSEDTPAMLVLDASGNVYSAGTSYGAGPQMDYAVVKYNNSGTQQWVGRYNGAENLGDQAASVAVDAAGNVYLTGSSESAATMSDIVTVKYNSAGVQQWMQKYNGADNLADVGNSVAVDAAGNVYVTGYTAALASMSDCITIKYNSAGTQQWLQKYNGADNLADASNFIMLDNTNNIYICGSSASNASQDDFVTIKYAQQVGITPISGNVPFDFKMLQNYPNPFNPATKIKFDISKESFVSLVIYNSIGKEVAVLANNNLKAGSYEADWNASSLPSGVYYAKINAGGFSDIKKMMLVK